MKDIDFFEICCTMVVTTLCLIVLGFTGTGMIRWYRAPHMPSTIERSIETCKLQNGVAYTSWDKPQGSEVTRETLERCEKTSE